MLSDTLASRLQEYAIGPRIRALRLAKGISLVQLGKHSGLSSGLLSKIERGILIPPLPTLLQIALVFDVGLEQFFADKAKPAMTVVRKQIAYGCPTILTANLRPISSRALTTR